MLAPAAATVGRALYRPSINNFQGAADDRSNVSQRRSDVSIFQNGFFDTVLNPDFSCQDFKKRSMSNAHLRGGQ